MAYRVTARLQVGLEANPAAGEVLPTLNWIISPASDRLPLITLGTSSDRIFSDEGTQAYYVTFAKSVPGTPCAPYVSINYSETDQRLNLPFGVNTRLHPQWDLLFMNDSKRNHLLLTYKQPTSNVSVMAIDLKRPRFGISFGFTF